MEEVFELPIIYKGKELLLPAQLHQFGYTYKIEVELNGSSVIFERDEERNWRAITDQENAEDTINREMLAAVATSLEQQF